MLQFCGRMLKNKNLASNIHQNLIKLTGPIRFNSNILVSNDLEIEYKEEIDAILASYKKKAETKQYIIGKVVSDKASKSITVQLQRQKYIPKYNCFQNVRKKFMAHDELEQCGEGDIVRVVPCRPMSRKKRFKLYEIIKKAPVL